LHVARSRSQPFAARHPSAQPATGRPLRSSRADRGDAPQLHQTDGCAVWGLEPSFGIARWQASAASMDAVISPVRGLRSLSVLWPSSGGLSSALGAVPPNLGAADP
jgi:hypothetical protein